jgi:hypothetical protein
VAAVTTTAAAGAASAGDQPGAAQAEPLGYLMDALFRKEAVPAGTTAGAAEPARPDQGTDGPAVSAEVTRIFLNGLQAGSLPPDDLKYVVERVAQRTGLGQAEAEQRVADIQTRVQAKAREAENALRSAADKARKASIKASLWIFVSLLVGAFTASLAATLGGRERDN